MNSFFQEEGPLDPGQSLGWIVDTYNNPEGPDQGYRAKVNGVNMISPFTETDPLASGDLNALVRLWWDPVSGMSLQMNGATLFSNIATPGFTPGDSYLFGFGARTGGVAETLIIDNLIIATPEPGKALAAIVGLCAFAFRRSRR